MSKSKAQTYSVEEFAELLGIGRNSAYEAIKRNEIPVIKVGRIFRIPKTAGDRLVQEGSIIQRAVSE